MAEYYVGIKDYNKDILLKITPTACFYRNATLGGDGSWYASIFNVTAPASYRKITQAEAESMILHRSTEPLKPLLVGGSGGDGSHIGNMGVVNNSQGVVICITDFGGGGAGGSCSGTSGGSEKPKARNRYWVCSFERNVVYRLNADKNEMESNYYYGIGKWHSTHTTVKEIDSVAGSVEITEEEALFLREVPPRKKEPPKSLAQIVYDDQRNYVKRENERAKKEADARFRSESQKILDGCAPFRDSDMRMTDARSSRYRHLLTDITEIVERSIMIRNTLSELKSYGYPAEADPERQLMAEDMVKLVIAFKKKWKL